MYPPSDTWFFGPAPPHSLTTVSLERVAPAEPYPHAAESGSNQVCRASRSGPTFVHALSYQSTHQPDGPGVVPGASKPHP